VIRPNAGTRETRPDRARTPRDRGADTPGCGEALKRRAAFLQEGKHIRSSMTLLRSCVLRYALRIMARGAALTPTTKSTACLCLPIIRAQFAARTSGQCGKPLGPASLRPTHIWMHRATHLITHYTSSARCLVQALRRNLPFLSSPTGRVASASLWKQKSIASVGLGCVRTSRSQCTNTLGFICAR